MAGLLLLLAVACVAAAQEGWLSRLQSSGDDLGRPRRRRSEAILGATRRRRRGDLPEAGTRGATLGSRRNATRAAKWERPREVYAGACGWCATVRGVQGRGAAASLDAWRGGEPPCDWCVAAKQEHAYCQGFGGRRCTNGVTRCVVGLTQLQIHCADVYATGAVKAGACSARCAHAATAAPPSCVAEWVRGHASAARAAASACGATTTRAFFGNESKAVVVFNHLQKTGGWSVVDYAQRSGVRCPKRVTNAQVPKGGGRPGPGSGEERDGCAGYRPLTPQDERLVRASSSGAAAAADADFQMAALKAHAKAFGLLHVEQPLPRSWPALLGAGPASKVAYVTVLREPIARALSHFAMATRRVRIPGIYEGWPFGREVALGEFAARPLADCPLCKRRGRATGRENGFFGSGQNRTGADLEGGGEFRHCCRKQWRYAADCYLTRELVGFASLAELPFGAVDAAHGAEAKRRLDAFDAVLLTEELAKAGPVLAAQLGWAAPPAGGGLARLNAKKKQQHAERRHDAAAIRALRARNAVDADVYAHGARLWKRAAKRL